MSKDETGPEACGAVDEAVSALGVARAEAAGAVRMAISASVSASGSMFTAMSAKKSTLLRVVMM